MLLTKNIRNFGVTGISQLIIQVIGVISGILVVRLLSTSDYALFTLANTMLGTMIILADGGISGSVMAQGGQVWNNKEALGRIMQTGLILRKRFAYYSLLFAIPILYYFLQRLNPNLLNSTIIISALIPLFFLSFSNSLLQIAPKLHQDVSELQKNQLVLNLLRLTSLVFLYYIPKVSVALLIGVLPLLWSNNNLKKISRKYIDFNQQTDDIVKQKMYATVKRVLPTSLYYCLSSQITIWLMSILGTTYAVAQLGALGRYSAFFSIITIIISTIIVPKYSKLPPNKQMLLIAFMKIIITLMAGMGIILIGFWLFATPLLLIIGKQYSGLEHELLLSMIGSCVSLLAGTVFSLYIARGWVINPIISIPINLVIIIVGIVIFNPSTIEKALVLNIIIAAGQLLMNFIYALIKINKVSNETTVL